MSTRRDFLRHLGLGAACAVLGPLLDLPILAAPSAQAIQPEAFITFMVDTWCDNPRRLGVITGISGLSEVA